MPTVKISELPPASSANASAVVPATNAAGTLTERVTLGQIAALAPATTDASALTTGTLNDARLSGNVVLTTDSRLTDARTPINGSVTTDSVIAAGIAERAVNWAAIVPFQASTWFQKGTLISYNNAAYRRISGGDSGASFNPSEWRLVSPPTTPLVVSLAYSATVTTDASAGDVFDITLTGNVTLANPTNPVNGKTIRWRIQQDGGGNRTVTLGSKFVIPSSATSPLPFSTAANKMDVLAATYHAGRDKWDVVAFVMGY